MSKKDTNYRFPVAHVVIVSFCMASMASCSLATSIITSFRAIPFGWNTLTCGLFAVIWLSTLVVWWAGKMWWFDFARWLNSTAQLHNDRVMPREKLKHGLVLYGCVAGSSLLTAGMSAADVLLMLIFIYILYGGIAALIILRHYLTYRQTYHKRTISFLEYCNLPNN